MKKTKPETQPDEIIVAQEMAKLNDRARTIQARLGVLNSELSKLSSEQHAIDLRRMQLRRDFDSVSNP